MRCFIMIKWVAGVFLLMMTVASYAGGVSPENCMYSKRGDHSVQEREYDKLLSVLKKDSKNKKKGRRKRTRSKGSR